MTAFVGPLEGPGEESFDFILCTPDWFQTDRLPTPESIAIGRHYVFVTEFNYAALEKFVRHYCSRCEGKTWQEVAEKVAHLGHWEFENYTPSAD